MQKAIQYMYPDIREKNIIKAAKYGKYAKTDIVISVRNKKKGIVLKVNIKIPYI